MKSEDHSSLVVVSSSTNNNNNNNNNSHPPPAPRSIRELFALFAVSFSYALLFASWSNILLAREVEKLSSTSQTAWVGTIAAVGAISQILTPISGALSDRSGAREPYLRIGSFLVAAGCGGLYLSSVLGSMVLVFVAFTVLSAGLSVQYAIISVVLHDYVSEEQLATGSAVMGTLGLLGAGCGYALIAVGLSLDTIIIVHVITTLFCHAVTVSSVTSTAPAGAHIISPVVDAAHASATTGTIEDKKKQDDSDDDNNNNKQQSTTRKFLEVIIHALTFPSPMLYPDFTLACASRALFNAGLAVQGFLIFFFRDVKNVSSTPPERTVSRLAVLALLGGLLGAVPAGTVADKFGAKPVIGIAAFICIVAIMSFPWLSTSMHFDIVGLIFGVGNASFLAVDYSLGVFSLPRAKTAPPAPATTTTASGGDENSNTVVLQRRPLDAAKDLGVFALSATGGQLVGQLICAGVLERFSSISLQQNSGASASSSSTTPVSRYAASGFTLVFMISSVCFACSAVAACFIKALR